MNVEQLVSDPDNFPVTVRDGNGGEIIIVNQQGWEVIRGIALAAVAVHKKDENKRKNAMAKEKRILNTK